MESFFAYSWHEEQESDMVIRIYGINASGGTTCVRVENFTPYMYVELPVVVDEELVRTISNITGRFAESISLMYKHHLYHYSKQTKPFLFCSFSSLKQRANAMYALKQEKFPLTGTDRLFTPACHEYTASAILQMTSLQKLPMSGWIDFKAGKEMTGDDKLSSCDKEYIVKWKNLRPSTAEQQHQQRVVPKIMSFDIEVNSEVSSAMPDNRPDDVVFQISCVFADDHKLLLTIGKGVEIEGVKVCLFENEEALLRGFVDVLNEEKPNVVTGYNILGFDIPYLVKRYERYFMIDDFKLAGYNKSEPARDEKIKWSSAAFKNQEFQYIHWEGILLVDLLPIVKRDYKLDNYKLQTVASKFLKAEKDPLTPKDIFHAYETMDPQKLSEVGKYCVKDSELVLHLNEYFHCWVSLSEMAKVCHVEMFTLYTKGQQIKIYSQVYKYCLHENIVVNTNGYDTKVNEQYTGAYVFDPVPGYYENVVPLDFSSLYPSIIIAYNICYSTIVFDPSVPDTQCNVLEWEDHVGCEHDPVVIETRKLTEQIDRIKEDLNAMRKERDAISVKTTTPSLLLKGQRVCDAKKVVQKQIDRRKLDMDPLVKQRQELVKGKQEKRILCVKRRYRFYKREVQAGVIPIIIQNLLSSRNTVKEDMKKEVDPQQKVVLDKKQLAYKVSANSMYGAMGVRKGLLPLMPGAMCITYIGRKSIGKVSDLVVNQWSGELVYGDTDSNYVRFPHIATISELWDHAIRVAAAISAEFPSPMKLEFEQAVYVKFLILSKKRYMYQAADRHGTVHPEIGTRGVLLARRDNSAFIRNTYKKVVHMIFEKVPKADVEHTILTAVRALFENTVPTEEYVITKSVGDAQGEELNEEGKLGDYKVKPLSIDPETKAKQLKGSSERAYYISLCPAPVQLADKMKRRGVPVDVGSRLEYVVLRNTRAKTQGQKLEAYDYFEKRKRFLRIDPLYYAQSMINPFDQLLSVLFPEKEFMQRQVKYHAAYGKVIDQLNTLFSPRFTLRE